MEDICNNRNFETADEDRMKEDIPLMMLPFSSVPMPIFMFLFSYVVATLSNTNMAHTSAVVPGTYLSSEHIRARAKASLNFLKPFS